MPLVAQVYNNPCIDCGSIEFKMIRVGAFHMCPTCFDEAFVKTGIATQTSDGHLLVKTDSSEYQKRKDKQYKEWKNNE